MSDRSVSSRPRLPGSGILFLTALAVACTTEPAAPPEDLAGPAVGIAILPDRLSLLVGQTGQLVARVYDAAGRTVPALPVWASAGPAIATVSRQGGRVTAVSQGLTTVTVSAGELSARANVQVSLPADASGTITLTRRSWNGSVLRFEVLQYSLDGGRVEVLPGPASSQYIAWAARSPDGNWIALEVIDSVVARDMGEDGVSVEYASDIYLVATGAPGHEAWRRLTTDRRSRSPAWSPDGSRIAYLSPATPSEGQHIHLIAVNTEESVRLTQTPGQYSTPRWSPDGTALLYSNGLVGNSDVFIVSTDPGGPEPTNVTQNPAWDADPSWSPDGTRIVFVSNRDEAPDQYRRDIYVVDRSGANPTRVTDNMLTSGPLWSPDGSYIVFAGIDSARAGLFLARIDGSSVMQLTTTSAETWDAASDWSSLELPGGAGSAIPALQTPLSATMQFGQSDVGSPFPPAADHDQSAHAKDNIVPGTVVIDRGGTVTFEVPAGAHQIAIYGPGTEPEDIDTGVLVTLCPGSAPRLINDPQNRVALITSPCGSAWQAQYSFDTPGRYLVICAFLPHFQVGMYGWVEVRERE